MTGGREGGENLHEQLVSGCLELGSAAAGGAQCRHDLCIGLIRSCCRCRRSNGGGQCGRGLARCTPPQGPPVKAPAATGRGCTTRTSAVDLCMPAAVERRLAVLQAVPPRRQQPRWVVNAAAADLQGRRPQPRRSWRRWNPAARAREHPRPAAAALHATGRERWKASLRPTFVRVSGWTQPHLTGRS